MDQYTRSDREHSLFWAEKEEEQDSEFSDTSLYLMKKTHSYNYVELPFSPVSAL